MKHPPSALRIDLIADGIADPRNVPALLALAEVMDCRCLFRDRHDLRGELAETPLLTRMIEAPPLEAFGDHYDLILAVENHENARSVFEYRPPSGKRLAVVVGNERRGLDRKMSRLADVMLEIPMRQRSGISLNVASAAAAALYQLTAAVQPKRVKRTHGDRPALVFLEPHDAADLGTSLRTAFALGWEAAYVVDTHHVWFGADRATLAQGRGAARRHKTAIRVRPLDPVAPSVTFDRAILIGSGMRGTPIWQMRLPERGTCALVFADEVVELERWAGLAREWTKCSLDGQARTPCDAPLRILSAVTLTELARLVR